jgi:hypothetical protein
MRRNHWLSVCVSGPASPRGHSRLGFAPVARAMGGFSPQFRPARPSPFSGLSGPNSLPLSARIWGYIPCRRAKSSVAGPERPLLARSVWISTRFSWPVADQILQPRCRLGRSTALRTCGARSWVDRQQVVRCAMRGGRAPSSGPNRGTGRSVRSSPDAAAESSRARASGPWLALSSPSNARPAPRDRSALLLSGRSSSSSSPRLDPRAERSLDERSKVCDAHVSAAKGESNE